MVSLNTILAVGGIGAAYLIFKNLGGAAGIGSSIGQGFNVFGKNVLSGLNFAKDLNNFDNPLNTSVPEGFRIDPTETRTYDQYIAEYENPLKDEMKTEKEDWTPFKFNEGAYGLPITKTGFAGQGLITPGYQAPNYSTSGAGYSNDSFFGGNTSKTISPGVATSSQKSTLRSLTGGLLG
jgi:hypothetical protein